MSSSGVAQRFPNIKLFYICFVQGFINKANKTFCFQKVATNKDDIGKDTRDKIFVFQDL